MISIHSACPRCENEEIVLEANFCKICGLDLRISYATELDKSYTLKDVDKFFEDCRMTIQDFREHVECGGIIDYDGHGHYATATQESNIYVDCDTDILDEVIAEGVFTHVMWYNK
jgi:hypothetical protein